MAHHKIILVVWATIACVGRKKEHKIDIQINEMTVTIHVLPKASFSILLQLIIV